MCSSNRSQVFPGKLASRPFYRVGWRALRRPSLDFLVAEAEENLPSLSIATGDAGDRTDQPDSAGLGALLCGGAFEPVLLQHARLGGGEGAEVI